MIIPKILLKNLNRINIEDQNNYLNNQNCVICHKEINDNSFITDLPECNHMYHHSCISEWFKIKTKCPICKRDYHEKFEIVEEYNNQYFNDLLEQIPQIYICLLYTSPSPRD